MSKKSERGEREVEFFFPTPLTDRAELLERRPDDDPSRLGARGGRVVRAELDAVPLPGLQLERRGGRYEHGLGGRERDAVDGQQPRPERHAALKVDQDEPERGAADEDELGVGRGAARERRGVDHRRPARGLLAAAAAAAAAPRRPHAGEPVDLEALWHRFNAVAIGGVDVLLCQRRGPLVVLVRDEDGRRVDAPRELRDGGGPRVRDDEGAAEPVDVGELLRVVVVPVRPGVVDDEVVKEDGRQLGDIPGGGGRRREFPPPPERHPRHSDLRDPPDAVHEVRLDL